MKFIEVLLIKKVETLRITFMIDFRLKAYCVNGIDDLVEVKGAFD